MFTVEQLWAGIAQSQPDVANTPYLVEVLGVFLFRHVHDVIDCHHAQHSAVSIDYWQRGDVVVLDQAYGFGAVLGGKNTYRLTGNQLFDFAARRSEEHTSELQSR